MDTITKTVKLSATLRQLANAKVIEVDLMPGATVRDLLQVLTVRYPALAAFILASDDMLKPGIQLLVDGRHIDFLQGFDTPLEQAQQVFLIPPIMGG
ncbi:MAG: MoaD family protein [Anaerolineae bacterium]|nr:MoaD family protein [Anaerolineae bacterium]